MRTALRLLVLTGALGLTGCFYREGPHWEEPDPVPCTPDDCSASQVGLAATLSPSAGIAHALEVTVCSGLCVSTILSFTDG